MTFLKLKPNSAVLFFSLDTSLSRPLTETLPVHYCLVCALPLFLISISANLRIQLLQVDSCHVSTAPHWH